MIMVVECKCTGGQPHMARQKMGSQLSEDLAGIEVIFHFGPGMVHHPLLGHCQNSNAKSSSALKYAPNNQPVLSFHQPDVRGGRAGRGGRGGRGERAGRGGRAGRVRCGRGPAGN